MSLFKFLEQFFYNKRISISGTREQEFLGDFPQCPHSLFRDCEMTFRFKQLKTTMKFEHLDAYSLDLYHFGLQKGTVTDEMRVKLAKEKLE